jgi:hypothetical protein
MDNLNHTGLPDNVLISMHESYEVRDWAKKFGCTEEQLQQCGKDTGSSSAKKIAECLKKKGQLKNGY